MEGELEVIKKVASSDSRSQFNFSIKTRESAASESNWTLVFNVIKLPPALVPSVPGESQITNQESIT